MSELGEMREKGINPVTGKYFPYHDCWNRDFSCSACGKKVIGLVICPEKILHEIDCAIYDNPRGSCTCNAEERAITKMKEQRESDV